MKFKKFILCLMACILGLSILLPVRTFADNNNLNINAESAILIDGDTGKVLYEKSANEKREPASTTKIMTALLTLENCKGTRLSRKSSWFPRRYITSVPLVSIIFITVKAGAVINGSMTVVAVLFGIFMDALEVLVAFIQAYIFTMLSSVFIGLAQVKPETNK